MHLSRKSPKLIFSHRRIGKMLEIAAFESKMEQNLEVVLQYHLINITQYIAM